MYNYTYKMIGPVATLAKGYATYIRVSVF